MTFKSMIFDRIWHQNTKFNAAKISNFGFEIEIQVLKSNFQFRNLKSTSKFKIDTQKLVLPIPLESRFGTSKFEFSAFDLV